MWSLSRRWSRSCTSVSITHSPMNGLLTAFSVSHVWVPSHCVDCRYIRSLFRWHLFANLHGRLNCLVNFCWVFLRALLGFIIIWWRHHLANTFVVDHYTQTSEVARIDVRLRVEVRQTMKLLVHITCVTKRSRAVCVNTRQRSLRRSANWRRTCGMLQTRCRSLIGRFTQHIAVGHGAKMMRRCRRG